VCLKIGDTGYRPPPKITTSTSTRFYKWTIMKKAIGCAGDPQFLRTIPNTIIVGYCWRRPQWTAMGSEADVCWLPSGDLAWYYGTWPVCILMYQKGKLWWLSQTIRIPDGILNTWQVLNIYHFSNEFQAGCLVELRPWRSTSVTGLVHVEVKP